MWYRKVGCNRLNADAKGNSKINLQLVGKKKRAVIAPKRKPK
jgi:hypothetical protein